MDALSPQAQASELSPEQRVVLHRIRKLMDFWQIPPEELLVEGTPPPPPAPLPPGPPKYRHPIHGDTWDGQGAQPEWLRRALLSEGFLVEELKGRETP